MLLWRCFFSSFILAFSGVFIGAFVLAFLFRFSLFFAFSASFYVLLHFWRFFDVSFGRLKKKP